MEKTAVNRPYFQRKNLLLFNSVAEVTADKKPR